MRVMRDEFVVLNSMRFRYREWGEADAEPIVLLHGVLVYADTYDAIAERMSGAGRRVIVLDQRGHGQSEHADDYSWRSCEKDLEALWDALGLGRVDVIGHSWGGAHACHLAALRPDAVKRLVLLDAGPVAASSPDEPGFWAKTAKLVPADGYASREEFIELAQRVFPRAQHDALVLHSRGLVVRDGRLHWQWMPDFAVAVAQDREPSPEEEREMCGRVRCPVLVMRAEHSELFDRTELDAVVDSFPSATGVELPESGHMIMWENPNGVADLALGYLASAA
jgi:pimeloyl-ACP methyl ester carboxylesterase